jgi:hypothetical protein
MTMIGVVTLLVVSARPIPAERSATAQPAVGPGGFPAALHAPTLSDNIDALAGLHVKILNARIVEVLEPSAFLIEAATRYRKIPRQRDRILVLVDRAALRVPGDTMTSSTIAVVGIGRTVLGMRAAGDVQWPVGLDDERIERLEVRAAVLATSVQTAEGTELTDRK